MDAVEFIKEHGRMCRTYYGCDGCLARNNDGSCKFSTTVGDGADEQIALLKEWVAAHPRKTRQSVFLEQWPNANLDKYGVLMVCPKDLIGNAPPNYECGCACSCSDCRRDFWMQEVE